MTKLNVSIRIMEEINNQTEIYSKEKLNNMNKKLELILNAYRILYMRKLANLLLEQLYKKYSNYLEKIKIQIGKKNKYTFIAVKDEVLSLNKIDRMQVNLIIDFLKFIWDKGSSIIHINDKRIKKLPYLIHKNDKIEIKKEKTSSNLEILYEDINYLIVNKEAGLLTINTDKKDSKYEDTLYRRVREYLNSKKEMCFIVNRIDKETSGIVIFVKNDKLKEQLQSNWNNLLRGLLLHLYFLSPNIGWFISIIWTRI